jgi:hypothetical protein
MVTKQKQLKSILEEVLLYLSPKDINRLNWKKNYDLNLRNEQV